MDMTAYYQYSDYGYSNMNHYVVSKGQSSDRDTLDESDQDKTIICQPYYRPQHSSSALKQHGNKKLKNQLCKNFMKYGYCHYNQKCQFAHGIDQLRKNQNTNSKYKTKQCSAFFNDGVCMYGKRCNFQHSKKESSGHVSLEMLLRNYPQLVTVGIKRCKFFEAMEEQY